jgi:predicted N-acetyltransferase YhbS
VSNEAFMILVLKDGALSGISGVAKYRPEFADVT